METNYFKGIALSLATAVAMFVFILGISGYPWWMMLIMSVPVVYPIIKLVKAFIVKNSSYEWKIPFYMWMLNLYLSIQGIVLIMAHYEEPIAFVVIPVTIGITFWNVHSFDKMVDIIIIVISIVAQIVAVSILMPQSSIIWEIKDEVAIRHNVLEPSSVEFTYTDGRDRLVEYKLISREDVKNIKNIFDLEEFYNSKSQRADKLAAKLDSMKNVIKVRDYDKVEVPETRTLYIKRLWYNSDQTPWSYEAYGKVGLNSTHRHSLFTSSSEVKLDLDIKGEYVGEYSVEYVNIVLSDNSFFRFKVADNVQWLLAKEGDEVTKVYYKSEYKFDYSKINQKHVSEDVELIIK